MRFQDLPRFALLLFFATLSWAGPALAAENSPAPATESSASIATPAAARISELEAKVAELERALREKEEQIAALRKADSEPETSPAAEASEAAENPYEFEPRESKFLFLNLGVGRSYLKLERSRLLDNLRTQIPPLYEPAFSPFHGYTLPQRATRVAFKQDRFINNEDFGRDKFYSLFFDNVKVENQHVEADFFYGLTDDTTLRVNVPFRSTNISGDGAAFRIQPMRMSMNGRAFGIGDVTIFAKHKWWDQGQRFLNLATVFGVQLPTGENDNRFNDAQTLSLMGNLMPVSAAAGGPKIDLFSDDLRVPNSAQPGTGAWGMNFGLMGTRQLTWNRFRGALHAGALYKWFADTSEGVRPGNELIFAVSFVRPPTRSEKFTFDVTLLGRNKQSERFPGLVTHPEADANGMPIMDTNGNLKMFTTPRPPFQHGTTLFLSPSLVFIPKGPVRITLAPLIRIYEPQQGPSPRFRLILGITNTF